MSSRAEGPTGPAVRVSLFVPRSAPGPQCRDPLPSPGGVPKGRGRGRVTCVSRCAFRCVRRCAFGNADGKVRSCVRGAFGVRTEFLLRSGRVRECAFGVARSYVNQKGARDPTNIYIYIYIYMYMELLGPWREFPLRDMYTILYYTIVYYSIIYYTIF